MKPGLRNLKFLFLLPVFYFLILPTPSFSQSSNNINLIGHRDEHRFHNISNGLQYYSSVWGYTAPNGREYAFIGYSTGTAIYDITDSSNVRQIDTIPGPPSYYNYREFTVSGNYLYIVSEGTGQYEGIQIVNLSYLPDSVHHVMNWIFPGFNRAHTIKSSGNYLYVNGGDYNGGGVFIVDVTNPEAPVKKGEWGGSLENYVHDCFIRNDTIFAANIQYSNRMSILNAVNKDSIKFITDFLYPNGVCHQVWTTNDRRWLLTCDEGGSKHMRIWNSEDLNNITFVYEYFPFQDPTLIHNAYFNGSKIFMAHYGAGVIVLDASNLPAAPTLLGYYDTYPAPPTPNYLFNGAWNVYCYYPSGKFVVSDMQTGLYVFRLGNAIGIKQISSQVPSQFKLEQNYPNPFNPSTKIRFEVPLIKGDLGGFVGLKVYNALGQEVSTLVNPASAGLKSGTYEVEWNASNLPSGVYFYKFDSQGFTETKKMVLVK